MRLLAPILLLVAIVVGLHPEPAEPSSGCAKTYTRAHFHTAARSTFDRAFPLEQRKQTLARIVRCQRYEKSDPIVRKHRRLYRHAWAVRFYWVREWARVPAWLQGTLQRIASCESGGNPRAISPGGTYRGLLQFDFGTWASVGGSGDPAAASALEQYVRGAILYGQRGAAPWPICGAGQ